MEVSEKNGDTGEHRLQEAASLQWLTERGTLRFNVSNPLIRSPGAALLGLPVVISASVLSRIERLFGASDLSTEPNRIVYRVQRL